LVLHRLSAAGSRFKDEINIFGYSRTYLSLVFNDTLLHLGQCFKKLLYWDEGRLTAVKIQEYAQAVEAVAGARGVWGFIDGTMRPFCRPGDNQQDYYSGHKKHHGFQFQCIMTPDGLMSSLHGPYMGPTGDRVMWNDSNLESKLRELLGDEDGVARYYLNGDLAYWPAFGIMGPYRPQGNGMEHSRAEQAANVTMSSVHIVVECGFSLNVNYWGINNYKRGSKIGPSPVALYNIISTLFTNFHTCLHGWNLVSDKFHLEPPTLEEYV
ncbi:hypothetical protein K440DRAFT_526555, partial [Wilcoxina mikolae CBS 423.85]